MIIIKNTPTCPFCNYEDKDWIFSYRRIKEKKTNECLKCDKEYECIISEEIKFISYLKEDLDDIDINL